MGRLLISKLLEYNKLPDSQSRYVITTMNRGKTPSPFEEGEVEQLICDRLERVKCIELLSQGEERWQYVIDFIGFHPLQIDDLARGLTREDGLIVGKILVIFCIIFASY